MTDTAALRALLPLLKENPEAALAFAAVELPALLDKADALAVEQKIVDQTAGMGLCSQTHHEHLMIAARKVALPADWWRDRDGTHHAL